MKQKHLVLDFCGVFLDCSGSRFYPMPEMVHLLELLKEKSYAIYGFSNMSFSTLEILKTDYSSAISMFEMIVISDMLIHSKPHPDSFKQFLKITNLLSTDIIFIDDSLANVETAKSLGIASIHYKDIPSLILELKESANVVF